MQKGEGMPKINTVQFHTDLLSWAIRKECPALEYKEVRTMKNFDYTGLGDAFWQFCTIVQATNIYVDNSTLELDTKYLLEPEFKLERLSLVSWTPKGDPFVFEELGGCVQTSLKKLLIDARRCRHALNLVARY